MSLKRKSRTKLYSFFLKGRIPVQEDFEQLIDSNLNLYDDKVLRHRHEKGGNAHLAVGAGTDGELLSFYTNIDEDTKPKWEVDLNKEQDGLEFKSGEKSVLFLQEEGKVGIGTHLPKHTLEVEGSLGARHRVGTLASGTVPADGQWHSIMKGLDGLNAFEVVGYMSRRRGHSMLHAIALNAYAGSRGRINQTRTCTGGCRHRIRIRWTGDPRNYSLQIRTQGKFSGSHIQFHVTSLLPGIVNPAVAGFGD
jgi:hypothetical protein